MGAQGCAPPPGRVGTGGNAWFSMDFALHFPPDAVQKETDVAHCFRIGDIVGWS